LQLATGGRATEDWRLATSMILLIDNYDSFVYNLARYVRELGETPLVRRHDAIDIEAIRALAPSHIVISPGPCSPREAGISTELVRQLGPTTPILGVCLGHQCIGAAYGGEILRAGAPMHGKTSRIHHTGAGLFHGLPNPFTATRYHSLVIASASLPDSLIVTATAEDGEIMAVQHVEHPVYGVQFHPESVLTEHGYRLLDHFLHGIPATPRSIPQGADGALLPRASEESTLAAAPPPVDLVR
jgi:anthranilate synthase/aminodeoxychorismate synthase-like glutamine amidotransferase